MLNAEFGVLVLDDLLYTIHRRERVGSIHVEDRHAATFVTLVCVIQITESRIAPRLGIETTAAKHCSFVNGRLIAADAS